jgi:hypothetical protein
LPLADRRLGRALLNHANMSRLSKTRFGAKIFYMFVQAPRPGGRGSGKVAAHQ